MAISKTSAKFTKEGDTLNYTVAANGTAVKCGAFLTAAGCNCLALREIAAGTTGALKILQRGEVVTITTDDAIGQTNAGVAVYLDGNNLVTKSATRTVGESTVNNTLLGYTAGAVTATDLSFDIICA